MIIGIAGTAKNTGKTTALAAMVREAEVRGHPVAVTGIGYDGEDRDTITGLPKPRLVLPAGSIATTSERCLAVSSAAWEVFRRTGHRTPLGDLLMVRITRSGSLVVAGPSTTAALRDVCQMMSAEGPKHLFVDGSLNRIAPMVAADRIVFATGAARTTDLKFLAEETAALEEIFSVPRALQGGEDRLPTVEGGPVFDQRDAAAVLERSHGMSVKISGLTSLEALQHFSREAARHQVRSFEFTDPLKLLLTGDLLRASRALMALKESGIGVTYTAKPALVSFTVNPYFPSYSGSTYAAAYLPAGELLQTLRTRLHTPVTDVVAEGASDLLDRVLSHLLP